MTPGGSDDQPESSDSASFSIPSLELSDGLTASGNVLDVEDVLASSCSAHGPEATPLSAEDAGPKHEDVLGAAGETSCSSTFLAATPPFYLLVL